ncbi:MAG TPA: FAD-dependent oxidoreductase [Syntrophorhabdales bacterium]|nr:FAD-dependent oxidoreductase [Syntrophorhabdales bacterium]
MSPFKHALSPFTFGNVTVKNRIELAPACYMLTTHDGFVTREMVAYYQNFARGGAAIITIGESPIDFEYAKGHEFQLNLGDDKVINGLSRLVEAVHRYGAKLSIELHHPGRYVLNGRPTIGPSAIPAKMEEIVAAREGRPIRPVTEMNQEMIDRVIEHFADAAFRCLRAGFEMVMVHGAHNHLIAQFLSPYTNKRTDGYGGSFENRSKFAIQVLTAIRKKVGDKLALEYRISADEMVEGGMTPEETIRFVKLIEDKIDLLHVSAGLLADPKVIPHMIQPTYWPHEYNVHYASQFKKALKVPIVTVGSITTMEEAERIIAAGDADMVAMTRAILADPEIVNKARRGQAQDVRPCLRCHTCNRLTAAFYPIRCAVNPVLGRELDYATLPTAATKRKIVVVGGGPAGIQAALTASQRGHEVVLLEKSERLGGNVALGAGLEIKADMKRYLSWLTAQAQKAAGVTIRMNTEGTPENVRREIPDAVVVAVGADPIIPRIPGVDRPHVVWAGDVHMGKAKVGDTVVVAGGGSTGAETAVQMAKDGKKAVIVEMLPLTTVIAGWPRGLSDMVEKYGVQFFTETKVEEVSATGVIVVDKRWNRFEIPADTVILSLGFTARARVVDALKEAFPEVHVAGDCLKPRSIKEAVHDGFNVAVEL